MSLVRKSWNSLVAKNYAWSRFPEIQTHCLVSAFLDFVAKFKELTGIDVPEFPGRHLTETLIQSLQGAHSVGIKNLTSWKSVILLSWHPLLLSKLTQLALKVEGLSTAAQKGCFDLLLS